jgi:exodeoxyribonuclease V beta subunit
LAQYPVVLIDEFQDTSPLQYQIFDRVYRTQANDPHSALILIGDPKTIHLRFFGAPTSTATSRRAEQTTGRHYVLENQFPLHRGAG